MTIITEPADPPPTHLEWPLRFATRPDGSVGAATVDQHAPEEFLRGLALACEVRFDQLPWDEEFGIPDPIGATEPDVIAREIEAALSEIDSRYPISVVVTERPDGGRRLGLSVLAFGGEVLDTMEVDVDAA